MSSIDLREDYLDLLIRDVDRSEYPSGELLDRIEAGIRKREHAEQYVELLFRKVQQHYPSLQLLDRIDRALRVLEYEDAARHLGAGPASRR